jgi:hypothetical protein
MSGVELETWPLGDKDELELGWEWLVAAVGVCERGLEAEGMRVTRS